jgi:seryl-tRNA synthetase
MNNIYQLIDQIDKSYGAIIIKITENKAVPYIKWYKKHASNLLASKRGAESPLKHLLINKLINLRSKYLLLIQAGQDKYCSIEKTIRGALVIIIGSIPNIVSELVPKQMEPNIIHTHMGEDMVKGQKHNHIIETSGNILLSSKNILLCGPYASAKRMLEREISNYLYELGLLELNVPAIVSPLTLFKTGHLPNFWNDLIHTSNCLDAILIPTAEVSIMGIPKLMQLYIQYQNNKKPLAARFFAFSDSFRIERGYRGKTVGGLLRNIQFRKGEIVSIMPGDMGEDAYMTELDFICNIPTKIFQWFPRITWRKLILGSMDLGKGSSITFDLEIWMPITKIWMEVSSVSFCNDYQFRFTGENMTSFNGSCLPTGRFLAALSEYYQIDEILTLLNNKEPRN